MHDYLSTPRKATFENFFKTNTKEEFQGIYRWHQVMSSSFMAVMNDFEIALRNTLHFSLSNHYDTANNNSFDWMGVGVINAGNAPMHISHQLNGKRIQKPNGNTVYTGSLGKIQDAIGNLTSAGKVATPDAVVAELTFAFWPIVLKQLKHPSQNNIRTSLLSSMFPHAPSHDTHFLDLLGNLLFQIRLLRNRLGHHDSLLKFREIDASGNAGFIPTKPRHTITSMKLMITHMQTILDWVDHELTKRLKNSDHWQRLDTLLSQEVLGFYRFFHGNACCYEKAVSYKQNVSKAKCYQARKKYRRPKYPKEHKTILSYNH